MAGMNGSVNETIFNSSLPHPLTLLPQNFNPATDKIITNPDGTLTFIHQLTVNEVMMQYWYVFAIFLFIITYLSYRYLAPKLVKKYIKIVGTK